MAAITSRSCSSGILTMLRFSAHRLELCWSETEVGCRMQGMQEAQVMQVMQNQMKSQLRGSGEVEGGGGGHCDPYAGRGRG